MILNLPAGSFSFQTEPIYIPSYGKLQCTRQYNDEGDVRTAKPCLLNKLFYYYDIYVDVTGARDGIQNLKKNVTDKTRFLHDK